MRSYFYLQKGKVVGPIHFKDICHEIEFGRLGGFDLIYRDDEKRWKPLGEFSELEKILSAKGKGAEKEDPDEELSEKLVPVDDSLESESFSLSSKNDETQLLDESVDDSLEVIPRVSIEDDIQWVILKAIPNSEELGKFHFKQSGPFTTTIVKKMIAIGEVEYQDFAWRESMSKWKPISKIDQLQSLVKEGGKTSVNESEFALEKFVNSISIPEISGGDLFHSVQVVSKYPVVKEEVPEEAVDPVLQEEEIKQEVPEETVDSVLQEESAIEKGEELREITQNPRPDHKIKDFAEFEKENLKFRILQGVFVSFIVGGIIGLAVFVSHGSLFQMSDISPIFQQLWSSIQPEKEVLQKKVKKHVVTQKSTKKKKVTKEPPKVQQKKVTPKAPKVASFIRLQLKNLSKKNPEIVIATDATHHFPTQWLLTGAAGQILNRPSYYRNWSQKHSLGTTRVLRLKKLFLGSGWYTLQVKVGTKKALKTFFLGDSKGFKKKVRDYRKILGVAHQREKEALYFSGKKLKEAMATANSLLKTQKLSPRQRSRSTQLALKNLSLVRSQWRGHLRKKNKHLWTTYWLELQDMESEAKDLLQAADKQPNTTRVNRQVKKFSKTVSKWVNKINGLSVAR